MKIKFGNRSFKNLSQNVDPRLVHIALELQNEEVICGAGVFETTRTLKKQKENVKRGVSQTLDSKHIPDSNGIVRAMDIVPFIDGNFKWDKKLQDNIVEAIRRVIKRLGYEGIIRLGADFKSFYDGIACLLYMNILRLKSDLKDREANREFLSKVAEMMRNQEAEIKVHAAKIKHIEKEVFKSNIRTE